MRALDAGCTGADSAGRFCPWDEDGSKKGVSLSFVNPGREKVVHMGGRHTIFPL